jgi:hypothetical protein
MATDMQKWIGRTARLEEEVKGLSGGPQLAKSSIENGAVLEYDETGQLVSSIGKQYDGSHVAVPLAGPVPPVPVEAECQSAPGVIEARWNGKFANALVSTLDWSHLAAYVGDTADFEPDWSKQEATIRGELGDVAIFTRPAGTYYVRLASWSRTGKRSEASAAVEVIVPEVADGDAIAEALDQMDLSLAAVQDAVNGVNKVINATTDPDADGGSTGDRWQKWTTLATGGKLLKAWRWDGTEWIPELMDPSYLPLVDIGQGTFGVLSGGRLEPNSVLAKSIAVGDFTNYATIDPIRGINGVTYPTVSDGTYIMSAPGQTYLMFKDKTDTFPFSEGDEIRITFDAIAPAATAVVARIWTYKSLAAEASVSGTNYTGPTFTVGTTEASYSTSVKIGAVGPDIKSWILGLNNAPGVNAVKVRNVRAQRMNRGSMIVDGAFDARTITGPLIQTSAAALAGIKLGPNGLEGFNGLSRTFYLNPTTGAVELTGTIKAGSSIQGATITGAAITGGNIKMEDGNGYSVELSTTSNSAFARFRTPTSADATYYGGTIRGEEDTWYGDPRTSTVVHSPTSLLFDIRGSLRLTAGRSSHPSMARDYEGRAYLNSQLIMEPNSADAKITTVAGKRLIVGPLDGDMILGGKNTDISSWTTGKVTVNGQPVPRVAVGSVNITDVAYGAAVTATISFPAGRFTEPPSLLAQALNGYAHTVVFGITTTSASVRCWNWVDGKTITGSNPVQWVAVGF